MERASCTAKLDMKHSPYFVKPYLLTTSENPTVRILLPYVFVRNIGVEIIRHIISRNLSDAGSKAMGRFVDLVSSSWSGFHVLVFCFQLVHGGPWRREVCYVRL